MSESRREAFAKAFSNINITAGVQPGFFDKYEDPIKALGQMQRRTKDMAIDLFHKSGISPEQLKGVNKVVLHTEDPFHPGTKALYHKADSSIHVNINGKNVLTNIAHEVGHHVNEHHTPEELYEHYKDDPDFYQKILSNVGASEAESDHFSNPNSATTNTYGHAVTHHYLTNSCNKTHGSYSASNLQVLGKSYLDRMKQINPKIHNELLERSRGLGEQS